MKKTNDPKSTAKIPSTPQASVHSDPNEYFPGDSVLGHSNIEAANELIARGEIGQQNENL
ncbi:MAG TPA: hypothetical protein VEY51_12410 [Chondromyces sp.]|nr:hypothetical protein [Chondromyces sp.]